MSRKTCIRLAISSLALCLMWLGETITANGPTKGVKVWYAISDSGSQITFTVLNLGLDTREIHVYPHEVCSAIDDADLKLGFMGLGKVTRAIASLPSTKPGSHDEFLLRVFSRDSPVSIRFKVPQK